MIEKQCKRCGANLGLVYSNTKYCDNCRKKAKREKEKIVNNIRKNSCNPPYDCFDCKKSDCDCTSKATETERKYHEAAELPFGRPGDRNYFTRIDDVIHRRNGRLV